MRSASTLFLVGILGGVVSIGACANALTVEDGSGGGKGEGGATSASASVSASTGMTGPCTSAEDCASASDACNVGTCINGVCSKVPANDGVVCNDGKTCTENDLCQAGVCTGSLKYCPSDDTCHVGFCDVETDSCMQIPGNDGAPCVDDDACTQTGSCSGGVCAPGQMVNCSFLDDACHKGTCDPQLGCVVVPVPDGTQCKDGFFCTINDHCESGTCVGDPNTCAAPGDVCKIGSCNEGLDQCTVVNGNNGGSCDDMNACTSGETCSNGTCGGGAPANQGGSCDDHDACTTIDTCANGQCVGSAAIVQCIDGDGCCPAACSLANDTDCVPACCGDKQNDFPPSVNCGQGAAWIAWKYVPSCGFNATRLEIHSNGGSVALLADNNDVPGAILFQGPLGPPDPQGWIGSDIAPPIALSAGVTYWIAEAVSTCSIATQGTPPKYYGSFGNLNGPWEGPYMDASNIWTAHIIGECAP